MTRHSLLVLIAFSMVVLMFLRLPPIAARQDSVLNTYGVLVEVDAIARQRYVEAIDDDRLVVGAIRGMLRQLDPYSRYYSPEQLAARERQVEGGYVGIGVEIGTTDDHPTIIAPLEKGPAATAGIEAGDRLLSIDGQDVNHLGIPDVEELLDGDEGSIVRLNLLHPGSDEPVELSVRRAHINVESVCGLSRHRDGTWDYMLDREHAIAYVRLSSFTETTASDFHTATEKALAAGAKGLILDLRFNPGGLLPQAVRVADRFLSDGVIVSTITRRGVELEYTASPADTVRDLELAVLINAGSASAAETLAGALQDHKRAVIVGERSFGKGSVQRLAYLANHEAAVKLTVSYYRLPSGRIVHRGLRSAPPDDWGIRPDVEVRLSRDEMKALQQSRFQKRPGQAADSGHGPENESAADNIAQILATDRQLRAAADLLRENLALRSN